MKYCFKIALQLTVLVMLMDWRSVIYAQEHQHDQEMPGMPQHHDHSTASNLIGEILHHASSGTTVQPTSTPEHMLMLEKGKWQLMLHGVGFLNSIQQSGPRG